MKKTHVVMTFAAVVSLLLLQLSCAGTKKQPVVEEKAPAAGQFLAGTHQSAGVSCNDCHQESPPGNEVPTAVCLTCHGDYKDKTASSATDPHNAHMEFPDCGNCHHAHRASENQCLSCHDFGGNTP